MIELVDVEPTPCSWVRYLNASPRGRSEVSRLPVHLARAHGLPRDLDALVATSDLQGVVPDPHTRASTLLGVAVAEHLVALADDGVIPRAERTGVVLAGDLYSVPEANRRGGFGDVASVWDAFGASFAWVVGVAGNHDDVTRVREGALDGDHVVLDGLRIGGVGRIAGDPAKLGRRDEREQHARIELLAETGLDVLVLHEGPCGDRAQPGADAIRALVERHRVPLTICGHVHWDEPLARHRGGQVLNVDTRAIVIVPA
ncbi:metallophosphoesterase family protein [Sandaracinus amylolyticus]|nr:metallophosphoesterase [Sandaracinus amylolyticus]